MRKPEWMTRTARLFATGIGAIALMALLTGCPPADDFEPAPPPPAPDEQPPPPSPQE